MSSGSARGTAQVADPIGQTPRYGKDPSGLVDLAELDVLLDEEEPGVDGDGWQKALVCLVRDLAKPLAEARRFRRCPGRARVIQRAKIGEIAGSPGDGDEFIGEIRYVAGRLRLDRRFEGDLERVDICAPLTCVEMVDHLLQDREPPTAFDRPSCDLPPVAAAVLEPDGYPCIERIEFDDLDLGWIGSAVPARSKLERCHPRRSSAAA